MSTNKFIGNKTSKVIGRQGYAYIIADKIVQFDPKTKNKVVNRRSNDMLALVVGANMSNNNGSGQKSSEIKPATSAAGILINQAVATSYVLNPEAKDDGLVLPQPVANSVGSNLSNTERGISNVTIFAEDHRYVAYGKGGINLHTGLARCRAASPGAGVSLIHGKSAAALEPMVKGNSLRKTIHNLETVISNINNNQFELAFRMMILTKLFAGHFHFVPQLPFGVLPSLPSFGAIIHAVVVTPSELKGQADNIINELNSILNSWNQSIGVKGSYLSSNHKLN